MVDIMWYLCVRVGQEPGRDGDDALRGAILRLRRWPRPPHAGARVQAAGQAGDGGVPARLQPLHRHQQVDTSTVNSGNIPFKNIMTSYGNGCGHTDFPGVLSRDRTNNSQRCFQTHHKFAFKWTLLFNITLIQLSTFNNLKRNIYSNAIVSGGK